MWKDLPPDIATVLRNIGPAKISRAINLFQLEGGRWMVSVQNPKNPSAYNVVHNDDIVMALLEALGPPRKGSWAEHLKVPVASPAPVEDDSDFDVV